jgi:hypothetical protein
MGLEEDLQFVAPLPKEHLRRSQAKQTLKNLE